MEMPPKSFISQMKNLIAIKNREELIWGKSPCRTNLSFQLNQNHQNHFTNYEEINIIRTTYQIQIKKISLDPSKSKSIHGIHWN